MKKKAVVFIGFLMAAAMLALPISAVSATKPEEITFFGYPLGDTSVWEQKGKSDNWVATWTDNPWRFSATGVITATGVYNGHWTAHGVTGPWEARSVTGMGVFEVAVSRWMGVAATGSLVIGATVGEHASWTILHGVINGKAVHGGGTSDPVPNVDFVYQYEGTIHFDP